MDIMDIDYTDPGLQNFIIQRCEEEEERKTNVINPEFSKNIVVRLGPKVACKFGTAVREAEADALTFASRNLNPAIIKVPRVFQYFTRPDGEWTMGYLVMTLVEGASLEHMPPGEAIQHAGRIMRAIQHIHGFCGSRPGPLDRSGTRGLLWCEYGMGPRINSREDLQRFLDRTLEEIKSDIKVDAMNMALSFCHLDIHPHNFIVTPDQSIWLLDWSCAGFYPAAFETWSIRLENIIRDNAFMNALGLHLVDCTSPAELALADALMHANLEERDRNL
jgi:aminoglycoside phosphotransferase (APT) family kinase protein